MSICRNIVFLIFFFVMLLSCQRKESLTAIVTDDKTAIKNKSMNEDELISHYSVTEDERIDKTIEEIHTDAYFLANENGTLITERPFHSEIMYKRVFIKEFEINQYCYPKIRNVYEKYTFDSGSTLLPDNIVIKSSVLLVLKDGKTSKCWLNVEYDTNKSGWIFLGIEDPYRYDNWAVIGKLEADNKIIFLRKYTGSFSVGRNEPAYDMPSSNGNIVWYTERTDDNDQINLSALCVTNDTFQGDYTDEHWVKVKDSYGRIGWFPGNVLDVERGGPKYLSPENLISSSFYEP